MRSGRLFRLWQDELGLFPPYRLDPAALFVGYVLPAEFGFHMAKGWGEPACALDAYVEFRHYVNNGAIKGGDRDKGFTELMERYAISLKMRSIMHASRPCAIVSSKVRHLVHRKNETAYITARMTCGSWRVLSLHHSNNPITAACDASQQGSVGHGAAGAPRPSGR